MIALPHSITDGKSVQLRLKRNRSHRRGDKKLKESNLGFVLSYLLFVEFAQKGQGIGDIDFLF